MHHIRFLRLAFHVFLGLLTVLCVWPFLRASARMWSMQQFSEKLLRIVNVRVKATWVDSKVQGPHVLYCNHVSWLDIFAINAVYPVIFIAKSEIANWPIAGILAKKAGTLFIERGKRHAVRAVITSAAQVLRTGGSVAVFPEGTTGTGQTTLPFHSNFVQAAIQASVPLLPVSLQFVDAQGCFSAQPAFVGEQTLMDNVRFLLNSREGFEVHLTFHTPLHVEGRTRHELSQHAQVVIEHSLNQGAMCAGGSAAST